MTTDTPRLEFHGSRLFTSWMTSQQVSLAFSTYQAGKLFLIGTRQNGELSVFERTFNRCMGLGVKDKQLWMSSLYQLWRFEDFTEPGEWSQGYDAVYVPVTGHTTGDLDIHDIHVGRDSKPIFVATRFNTLATLADRGSFKPIWRPPFIDRVSAEDRCHLNGMAIANGTPQYVTCVAQTNIAEGWREHRRDGGVLIDVPSGEVVVGGLSMPHSPRIYQDKVWMIQTGTGEFGWVDVAAGRFEPICFLPGFARGVNFVGDYAVVGVSCPREGRTFEGLALNEKLAAASVGAKCGLFVVNLHTGDVEHQLTIEGIVKELYDVAILPGVQCPMAIGFQSDEIRYVIRQEG